MKISRLYKMGNKFNFLILCYRRIRIMNQLATISEKLNALWALSRKESIFLDDLESEFKQDLQTFITGETLYLKDGKIVIGQNLYKKWLQKLQSKGFDYEINFKND
ncbi:hypothetical protein L3C95_29650 [Chitinophaga filiformis]|uniref:hypothetical protein n=1 Tax=Chitinophaga filiformis TaxID=104663 RepID=UPI001F1B7638|nr:hypothetical protein [Chitinophaga filiformis]MCF6407097.1 hypothetical protein [Chitinophaga filiformis]